eukprot:901385-Rhodomonas_salina.1
MAAMVRANCAPSSTPSSSMHPPCTHRHTQRHTETHRDTQRHTRETCQHRTGCAAHDRASSVPARRHSTLHTLHTTSTAALNGSATTLNSHKRKHLGREKGGLRGREVGREAWFVREKARAPPSSRSRARTAGSARRAWGGCA